MLGKKSENLSQESYKIKINKIDIYKINKNLEKATATTATNW